MLVPVDAETFASNPSNKYRSSPGDQPSIVLQVELAAISEVIGTVEEDVVVDAVSIFCGVT